MNTVNDIIETLMENEYYQAIKNPDSMECWAKNSALISKVPKYTILIEFDCRYFSLKAKACISVDLTNRALISASIITYGGSLLTDKIPDLHITGTTIFDKVHLSDYYAKQITKFRYTQGVLGALQCGGDYSKYEMAAVYKQAKTLKHEEEATLDTTRILAKIAKRFNIHSSLPLQRTIEVVNAIGKQKEPVYLYNQKFPKPTMKLSVPEHIMYDTDTN